MHIKRWLAFSLIGLLFGLLIGRPPLLQAATKPTNFVATPFLPKNQLSKKAGYFDLKVTPGQTQVLKLAVTNPGDTARTLEVIPVNATTSDAGSVVYIPSTRRDPSAQTTFTALTSGAMTIKLAPHQGKTVTFRTKIPAGGFRGQVLGGLFVTDPKATVPKPKSKKQNFRLQNRYAEVTAVSLTCQPKKAIPITLKLAAVKVGLQNNTPMVFAKIRNLAPVLFGQLQIQAQVRQKSTGRVITTQHLKQGSMAPNSWFNYGVKLGSKDLAAGTYSLDLHLTSGTRHWHFKQNFVLSAKRTREHNTTVKAVKQPVNWWLWLILALTLLSLLLVGTYWLGKQRSKKS
ncbi:DUF916 and DUF3324 domain-containing protein [Lactiplantibacillus daowaiensis]|uniref:DUF916 and DUF3324 domain-containing protein n=1 Tax=Lactiplantibacillus daowaiensis TaxID=2559918 RepID=A0ABW1RXK8_9LACO|nr:DUF916 and DUF3324 domain-containing protein [Lactiplantibacillus daowaiensis]